jgi:hypothetical protein
MFKNWLATLLFDAFIVLVKAHRKTAYRLSWEAANQYGFLLLHNVGTQIQSLIAQQDSDWAWSEWHAQEQIDEAAIANGWKELNDWRNQPEQDIWDDEDEEADEPRQVWLSEPPAGFYIYE